MKKYLSFFNVLYFLQAITVILIAVGVLPRYYGFFVMAAMAVYILSADWISAVCFSVAFIPFYTALPILPNLDQLVFWRFIFLEIFILFAIRKRKAILEKIKNVSSNPKDLWKKNKVECLMFVLLIIALISLIGAPSIFSGLKKLIYYINIFLFFIALAYGIESKEDAKKVLASLGFAGAVLVGIGFLQVILAYFIPLSHLGEFWASKVIRALYGAKLSDFSLIHNSWFAFSPSGAASIRMFSLFSGSLAFASGAIMLIIIPLSFYFNKKETIKNKTLFWISLIFILLSVILSGSRGSWLSIAFSAALVLYIFLFKSASLENKRAYFSKILGVFAAFILLFPFSPIFLGTKDLKTSSIGRLQTIADNNNVSNQTRLKYWENSWKAIQKHPFFGTGINNFSAESGGAYNFTSHNMFIYIATEMGIGAAIILLALCFVLIKDFLAGFLSARDEFSKMFFLSSLAAIAWVLGYSLLMDELINVDKTSIIFAVIIAAGYALKRVILKESAQSGKTVANR